VTKDGASQFIAGYNIDEASIGTASGGAGDFYIKNTLVDYDSGSSDCLASWTPASNPPISLDSAFAGVATPDQAKASMTNSIDWTPGSYTFCIRYELVLMTNDVVWHQKDFVVTVAAAYADGSFLATATVTEAQAVAMVAQTESSVAQTGTATAGAAPTISALSSDADGSLEYEEVLTLSWNYAFNVDIYSFAIDDVHLTDGSDVRLDAIPFVADEKVYNVEAWTAGTWAASLKIKIPLKVYTLGLTSVKIKWTINYSAPAARRNLRSLADGSETAYSQSGSFDEEVTVLLAPLEADNSGAINGYTMQNILAVCVAGGTALFI